MTTNGHRRRLDCLEGQLVRPDDEEADRWRTAWNAALETLCSTMAPAHVAGLSEEMAGRAHHDPRRPWGRVWGELRGRIIDKVGVEPGHPPRHPESPLALPPGVVEAVLDSPPNLRSTGLRCAACAYLLPVAGELVGVKRDDDGGWHYRDSGERCAEPALPDVASSERSMWRTITLFSACPLCGCGELASTVEG